MSTDDTRTQAGAPTVRAAGAADAPAIAGILASALAAKYRPAFGARAQAGIAGIVRDEVTAGASGFLVAELDGEPVGSAHIATLETLPPPRFGRRLAARVGVPTAVRAVLVLSLLRQQGLEEDEAHVGEVGVLETARRRGVATALMDAVEARARAMSKTRLTLWVTLDNTAAIPLYTRLGFVPRRRRTWFLGRLVFRSPGLQLMEKRIGGVHEVDGN